MAEPPTTETDFMQALLDETRARIRQLNDELRMHGRGGAIVVTAGITTLGRPTIAAILLAVAQFGDFNGDNDPYGEHDCGVMSVADTRVIWKIDYYDRQRRYASPDPSDPSVTFRVMTVMCANEY